MRSPEAQVLLVGSATRSGLAPPSECLGWTCCGVRSHSIAVTLKFSQFASGVTERPRLERGDFVGNDPSGSLRASVVINLVDVLAYGWDISPLHETVQM